MNQRQNIITALTTLLETLPSTIQIGVHDRRDIVNEPFTPAELPCINIMDGKGEIDKLTGFDDHATPVDITLFRSGITTPADVREDNNTIAALIQANYTLSGSATVATVISDEVINEQYGDAVVTGNLTVQVRYRTPSGGL